LSTSTTSPTLDLATHTGRNLALIHELLRAGLDDASVFDDLPTDATIVLLPTDDPAMIEANIEIGINALRHGQNVYFRYVHRESSDT
jgi:hypothetical protein